MTLDKSEREAVVKYKISNGLSTRTHHGVFSLLGEHFVSTGLISKEHNKFYRRVLELRQTGDYDDFIEFSENEIIPLLEPAKNFIAEIEDLIINFASKDLLNKTGEG